MSHTLESPLRPLKPGRQVVPLESAGRSRRYTIHVPETEGPYPVVLVLHGAGSSGSITLDRHGWSAKANREGFVAVAPDGLAAAPDLPMNFEKNPRVWNTGQLREDSPRARIDDAAFIDEVLADVARRIAIDENRISLVGHSNGAGMAFRLATERPGRFAALAVVASHCWVRDPRPARPIPTLFLVGNADPLVPMAGGPVEMPWGGVQEKPAVAITLTAWAQAIGCRASATTLSDKDGVRIDHYESLTGGPTLTAYFLAGHGHAWPGSAGDPMPERYLGPVKASINATDVVWGFCKRHVLSK